MKIKMWIGAIFALLISLNSFGQDEKDPIKWTFSIQYEDNNEATLIMKADLFGHYHVFSQKHSMEKAGGTGFPTEFIFDKNPNYKLIGSTREGKPEDFKDDLGSYKFFMKKAVFKQRIKVLNPSDFNVTMKYTYQICDEVGCRAPQFDVPYNFGIKKDKLNSNTSEVVPADNVEIDPLVNPVVENNTTNNTGECRDFEEKESPINWSFRAVDLGNKNYELVISAKMDSTWYLLAQDSLNQFKNLAINVGTSKLFALEGGLNIPFAKNQYDSIYKRNFRIYDQKIEFRQKLKLTSDSIPFISGDISFTAFSNVDASIAPTVNFNYDLKEARAPIKDGDDDKSYWGIFIAAFVGGFAALLTPCVFPMIPMTVSFFTKQSKSKAKGIKNAWIYGLSIIVIYLLLGLGVTWAFGSDAMNKLSTNVWFNIFFFLLLVVFGASFLGAFEIKLPSRFVNKIDKQADRGGLLGIFFMAFTLALVSFSCTGPIIGTLLVEAASQGGMSPFFGMLGFSTALALPFMLFAAFPGWLNSLPQSGGWLNSVKVFLGFLEIALAFKFLSNADLVVEAHLLEREIFIAFWIVIFGLLGFYLLGKIKLSHDSDMPHIKVPRLFMSIVVFAFVAYLIPGMWGAPLKLISGFPPPQHYSEIPYGIQGQAPTHDIAEGQHHGPHGIPVFHEYDLALAHSKEVNKPLLIDFTGHACINCRKMEDQVWSQEDIKEDLIKDYVIASLHVDEKKSLPSDQYVIDENGKTLTTVGEKWSHLERVKYGKQTQPLYVMLDENEEKLNVPTSYDSNPDLFRTWLESGSKEFENRKNAMSIRPESFIESKKCLQLDSIPNYGTIYKERYKEEYQD